MNAEEFAAAVSAAYPVPEETFAKAKWMGEAADACQVLAKQYRKEEATLTLAIQNAFCVAVGGTEQQDSR